MRVDFLFPFAESWPEIKDVKAAVESQDLYHETEVDAGKILFPSIVSAGNISDKMCKTVVVLFTYNDLGNNTGLT
jgi:hypothetical protein